MSHPVSDDPTFIEVGHGEAARRIALRIRDGAAPGLFWMSGFKSDMQGGKALTLELVDSNLLTLATSVPLAQFASVHKRAPATTLEQYVEE